jgi:hypothetical protein
MAQVDVAFRAAFVAAANEASTCITGVSIMGLQCFPLIQQFHYSALSLPSLILSARASRFPKIRYCLFLMLFIPSGNSEWQQN